MSQSGRFFARDQQVSWSSESKGIDVNTNCSEGAEGEREIRVVFGG